MVGVDSFTCSGEPLFIHLSFIHATVVRIIANIIFIIFYNFAHVVFLFLNPQ